MDKQISRKFFNISSSHWDETVRNNDPVKLKAMIRRLSFRKGAHVLDVGTGTGVFVPFIQSRMNGSGRITCVDFSFRMLEIAEKKNGNGRVGYVCAEIETLGLAEEMFDAAVCYSTFPHFHDKPLALENIHSLLKKGGKIFICHTASRETINSIHGGIPDFADHLLPKNTEMHTLLTEAGLEEVKITNSAEYYLAEARKPIHMTDTAKAGS